MLDEFRRIIAWDGSHHAAWEEIAYQVRDRDRDGVVRTIRTRAPDAGVEWYEVFEDGHHEGFQAKYYDDLQSALDGMRESVRAVACNRPEMTDLTFVVPFNSTDPGGRRKGDVDRWTDASERWRTSIDGAERLTFHLASGSDVLAKLSLDHNAGRRAFWWGEVEISDEALQRGIQRAAQVADSRYDATLHGDTPVDDLGSWLAAGDDLREDLLAAGRRLTEALQESTNSTIPDPGPEIVAATRSARVAHDSVAEQLAVLEEASAPLWHGLVSGVATACSEQAAQLHAALRDVESAAAARGDAAPRDDGTAEFANRLWDVSTACEGFADVCGPRGQFGLVRHAGICLTGSFGVGKTQTAIRLATREVDAGGTAVVAFGPAAEEDGWWRALADRLGVTASSASVLLGALNACGEARQRRVLLVIDALNESRHPNEWGGRLREIVAAVDEHPWLTIVVTTRTEYVDLLRLDDRLPLPEVTHPGLEEGGSRTSSRGTDCRGSTCRAAREPISCAAR